MIYFDSAYIAKFYLAEPESAAVRVLAEDLATARQHGARALYSNDRRLLEAGRLFRMRVRAAEVRPGAA